MEETQRHDLNPMSRSQKELIERLFTYSHNLTFFQVIKHAICLYRLHLSGAKKWENLMEANKGSPLNLVCLVEDHHPHWDNIVWVNWYHRNNFHSTISRAFLRDLCVVSWGKKMRCPIKVCREKERRRDRFRKWKGHYRGIDLTWERYNGKENNLSGMSTIIQSFS